MRTFLVSIKPVAGGPGVPKPYCQYWRQRSRHRSHIDETDALDLVDTVNTMEMMDVEDAIRTVDSRGVGTGD